MKLDFLKLPSDERRLYIEQAAMQRNVSPVNFDVILSTLSELEHRINLNSYNVLFTR